MKCIVVVFSAIILISCIQLSLSSAGDYSKFYTYCVNDCIKAICFKGLHTPSLQHIGLPFSLWTCKEDCEYNCQWETVDAFVARKWPIPQFYGKWPFLRFSGLQEPASAVFSVFNFLVIVLQTRKVFKEVPSDSPYFYLWHLHSLVCLNAWLWSAIYHTRDSDNTERLDYIAATIMVFSSFYVMVVRVLKLGKTIRTFAFSFTIGACLIHHIAYLWLFKFNYKYNMIVNVFVGSLAIIGWLSWAFLSKGHPARLTISIYCLLIAASTAFELFDFPPILWIFDAHALWHFFTAFISILFYRFIRSDSIYLRTELGLPTQVKKD